MGYLRLFETFLFELKLSPDEIKDKFYQDVSAKEFNNIIAHDPTSIVKDNKIKKIGKYAKWLLQLYKGKKYKQDGKKKTYKLKSEDLYKAEEYLTLFDKFKRIIKEDGDSINIFDYNTLPELYKKIEKFQDAEDEEDYMSNRELEKKIKSEESEKVFENYNWIVVVPKTHRAACYYGKHTEWCTASKDSSTYFDQYSREGPIYININKETGDKYQFHFESGQFMNENDEPIDDLVDFLDGADLFDFYSDNFVHANVVEENGDWYFLALNGWSYFAEYVKDDNGRDDKFVADILSGNGYHYFDNYGDEYNIGDSYLDVNDKNLKYLKAVIQNMKKDFEIKQDDIDNIKDLSDIATVCNDYDLSDLEDGLNNCYSFAASYAAENEAYESIINRIAEHFSLGEKTEWTNKDVLKIKFDNDKAAKSCMGKLFRIDNYYEYGDDTDVFVDLDYPYYGFQGDSEDIEKNFNQEIVERLPDDLGKYDV